MASSIAAAETAVAITLLLVALGAISPGTMGLVPARPAFAETVSSKTSEAKAPPVTFNHDVAPIIFEHCASCHRPGQVAPFSLLSYEEVKKRAKLIGVLTARRYMPPWKPEGGAGQFQGARRLTDGEIKTIQQWVEEGAPEGKPGTLQPPPNFPDGWQLGQPDVVLRMPKPYTLPADSSEFYRCFVIPADITEDHFLSAFEVKPSNPKVVHHAIFAQDPRHAGRRLETDPGGGYPCLGGFGFPASGAVGFWTAGIVPKTHAQGIGTYFKKDSDVVLQLHFRPSGKPEQEQCSIGLYFAKHPPSKISTTIQVSTYAIDIPPGQQDYKVRSFSYVPFDAEVLSIFPHAHYLARAMKASATLPDGKVIPLLSISDWDFNWQEEYWYSVPPRLPQGTRVEMEFSFDNSAGNPQNPSNPPKRVTWGEATTDEMAEVHLRIVPADAQAKPLHPGDQK